MAVTGQQLKNSRKRQGLSRRKLANMAGVHPDTVKYWEGKASVELRGYGPERILNALGLGELSQRDVYPGQRFLGNFCTPMRARDRLLQPADSSAATTRERCGARTRKGTPCRAKAIPGKKRCKFHGGKSTGPRTAEGKSRIAEAQRRRWARWRSEKAVL